MSSSRTGPRATVTVFLNDGRGRLAPGVTTKLGMDPSPGLDVIAADFDDDGKADIAVSGGVVMMGKGDGTFGSSNT